MTSPAAKPTKFVLSKTKLVYGRTQEGQPNPTLDSLVPDIDIAAVTAFVMDCLDQLRAAQPELLLNNVKLLSGISGETLSRVLEPAKSACLRARQRYEDALVRAMQLAVSVGIYNDVPGFDVGTGTGSKQAADAAYDDGQGPESFAFAPRPALPQTPQDRITEAQANVADRKAKVELAAELSALPVSADEQLRTAGYAQKDVDKIQAERLLDEAEAALGEAGTDDSGEEVQADVTPVP